MNNEPKDYLLYDGDCPACRAYVSAATLERLHPQVCVKNARSEPALVAELRKAGYEINQGMMVQLNGRLHFGAEATRVIAQLAQTSPSRSRRLLLKTIGAAPWSRALYPLLNCGRKFLLRLLGRKLIG